MVPAQGVGLHENQGEEREDRKRHHFLNDLQFPYRERTAELCAAEAVCRNLEAVFEQGDAPTQQYDGREPKTFQPRFECNMPVPGERHECIRDNQQPDRENPSPHGFRRLTDR